MSNDVLARVQRLLILGGAGNRPSSSLAPMGHPDDARSSSTGVRWVGSVAAVIVPILFAFTLIPVRDSLAQSLSLLMVIPVLVFALLGGARLGVIAAAVGALAFDLFHTEPYYRFAIDRTADVIEMAVLLLVGLLTGVIASSAQRALAGAAARRRELDAVVEFVAHLRTREPERMIEQARSSIEHVLLATSTTWRPGYRGTAAPTLQLSGAFVATNAVLSGAIGGRRLPAQIEIPVGVPPTEHGRFIVHGSGAEVSIEERRTAAVIASALGHLLDSSTIDDH